MGFRSWLYNRFSRSYAKNNFAYARKYIYALYEYDPQIHSLSSFQKANLLKAVRAFTRYIGTPELFDEFKQKYGLKWNSSNCLTSLRNILNNGSNLDDLFKWAETVKSLGWRFYFPTALAFLTGLRAEEVFMVVRRVQQYGLNGYYNPEFEALEHFRFKEFLRVKKNAYLSFISPTVCEALEQFAEETSYNILRKKLHRENLKMRLQEVRRAWATYMRGFIPSEAVDLLQGRIPPTVFTKYYFRPDIRELGFKVLNVIKPWEDRLLP